jgi:hypothetical protein
VSVDSGSVPRPATPVPLPSLGVRDLLTRELLDAAVETAYAGEAWRELQRRLVERAFPDLERSISTGTIYDRCARAGVRIKRRDELQRHPYPEDIAAEAVEECLLRFRTSVLPAGEWDPGRGVSLEDFFCSCCLPDEDFAAAQAVQTQAPRGVEPVAGGHAQELADLGPGPGRSFSWRVLATSGSARPFWTNQERSQFP